MRVTGLAMLSSLLLQAPSVQLLTPNSYLAVQPPSTTK